jgi:hypothetical protein
MLAICLMFIGSCLRHLFAIYLILLFKMYNLTIFILNLHKDQTNICLATNLYICPLLFCCFISEWRLRSCCLYETHIYSLLICVMGIFNCMKITRLEWLYQGILDRNPSFPFSCCFKVIYTYESNQ